jgi:hypothetical protein
MSDITRREWLGASTISLLGQPLLSAEPSELIKAENQKPGTTDWQLTYTKVDPKAKWRSSLIEGFASKQRVSAGESIEFFVSTSTKTKVTIELYRMGFYQGKGGRIVATLGPFPVEPQATPAVGAERLRECDWKATASLQIPGAWPSGVYLGKLKCTAHRYESYLIFIVRDDRKADVVFQCSDNTWQAYNAWPENHSLYTNDRKDGKVLSSGVKVSFDRPYGKYVQIYDNPLSQGSGEFLLWEFPFAYWLEQHGYDVTYISNSDVHRSPACLTRAKAFLSIGHDEYWSLEQFKHVSAARDAGVNLLFFSGNSVCFVAPYSDSPLGKKNRLLTRAGRYGGVRATEKDYMVDLNLDGPNEATLMGAQTITPFNGSGDWICTKPDHWIFAGTGMKKGDSVLGLVGWEFHGDPAPIPGLEVVAEGDTINTGDVPAHYTATIYPGPKENFVFNASTIFWSQGLASPPGHMPPISHYGRPHGPDPRVQRMTKNLLDRAIR